LFADYESQALALLAGKDWRLCFQKHKRQYRFAALSVWAFWISRLESPRPSSSGVFRPTGAYDPDRQPCPSTKHQWLIKLFGSERSWMKKC
jgi:hypothetical protein